MAISKIMTWVWIFVLMCNDPFVNKGLGQQAMPEDWVDPGDMFNYDSNTQTMRRQSSQQPQKPEVKEPIAAQCPEQQTCDCPTEIQAQNYADQPCPVCQSLEMELQDCKSVVDGLKDSKDLSQGTQLSEEGIFFRQFVRAFLYKLNANVTINDDGLAYNLMVQFSSKEIRSLENYANVNSDRGTMRSAHDVLTSMIKSVEQIGGIKPLTWTEEIEATIHMPLSTVFYLSGSLALLSLSLIVLTRIHVISVWHLLFRLTMVLFVISIPWEWCLMYQKEVSKRQAETISGMPPECTPQHMSTFQTFTAWIVSPFTFSDDSCARYHENLLINPLLEVAPTQAFAATLTKFFVHPLEHIGKAMSKTIRALLSDLPFIMWPVALGFLFLILIMGFGYRLRMFPLLGLEPPVRAPAITSQHTLSGIPAIHYQQERPLIQGPAMAARPQPETLHAAVGYDNIDTADTNPQAYDQNPLLTFSTPGQKSGSKSSKTSLADDNTQLVSSPDDRPVCEGFPVRGGGEQSTKDLVHGGPSKIYSMSTVTSTRNTQPLDLTSLDKPGVEDLIPLDEPDYREGSNKEILNGAQDGTTNNTSIIEETLKTKKCEGITEESTVNERVCKAEGHIEECSTQDVDGAGDKKILTAIQDDSKSEKVSEDVRDITRLITE